ncbi:MAG: hypothetical protein ND866_27645 [Pyrinomonadaceae bacterium]|nr:hypothetical protein [Pyrinomonadaceae bacterium]
MANRVSTELAKRSLVFLAAVIFTCAISGQTRSKSTPTPKLGKADAAESQPSPPAAPSTSPDASLIGTPQIADKVMQLRQRLRSLPDRLAPEALLAQTEHEVTVLRETIGERARETEVIIGGSRIISQTN